MKKERVVIFGTGRAAQSRINILNKNKEVEILGVFGRHEGRLNKLKKIYGINVFHNLKKVFKAKPNISLIANQNSRHYSDALLSLKNGCDILVEKPLTTDIKKTIKLIKFAKKRKKKISVVLQRRYDESTIYLRKLVKEKFFGNIIFIKLNIFMSRNKNYFKEIPWIKNKKKSGGGILIHHAIHTIDQLLYILQTSVKKVQVFKTNKIMKMQIEDTAIGIIKFQNKILATIHATYCADKRIRNSIEIYGDKKSIILAGDKVKYLNKHNKKILKKFSINSRGSFNKIWLDFVSNKKNECNAESYLKTELLINKMYK